MASDGAPRLDFEASGVGAPPLVLVPGWCCDRTTMAGLAARLGESHRVVNVDLPGFGSSPYPAGGVAAAGIVDALRGAAAEAAIEKPVLVGHSLGAKFVLAANQRHPGWARALVLLDTSIVEAPDYVAARRAELDRPDWPDLLRARFDLMFTPASEADARQRIQGMVLGTPLEVARASLAAGDEVDTAEALAECGSPVLYIGAQRPREDPAVMLRLNPKLAYGQVVGSGHFVQIDALDQVAAMIERFLAA